MKRLLMNKRVVEIIGIITILLLILIGATGCDSASTVSHNISREADVFKVKRRITFINLRTNDYLFQMTGNYKVLVRLED